MVKHGIHAKKTDEYTLTIMLYKWRWNNWNRKKHAKVIDR